MTRTIITALAALASGLACEALPAEVVEKAKVCILDALGMGVGGVNIDNAKVAHRAFGALAAPGAATVLVTGEKVRALASRRLDQAGAGPPQARLSSNTNRSGS